MGNPRAAAAAAAASLDDRPHPQTAPGTRIDRVGFLGFAEIARAGVIDRGDQLWVNGHRIGTVLGFDACHFPNHYSVLIAADTPRSGFTSPWNPGRPFGSSPQRPHCRICPNNPTFALAPGLRSLTNL